MEELAHSMEAIVVTYKDGVLTPVEPLDLPEGHTLTLWIDPAAQQREHLTDDDRRFFEQLAARRRAVFDRLAE
jgi:predicted DNA-binding antitoxin AbrB/MazE fold protein